MRYEIKFKTPFTQSQLKVLKCDYHHEMNGCFWYDKDLIVINVGSSEYDGLSEDKIADLFVKVDTHERLHYAIFGVTNKVYNNDAEERFVCLMTEQEEW